MKDKTKLIIAIVFIALLLSGVQIFSGDKIIKTNADFYFIITLLLISVVAIIFVGNRIREKYLEDDPVLVELKELLCEIFPEINNTILLRGEKSYTINKSRIHICLKDENDEYYDRNMLIYVILHELAHVLCDEIGHTAKFHTIFKEVLEKAIKAGVYDDKIPPVKNYCEIPNKV
jgi:hypothetical protein